MRLIFSLSSDINRLCKLDPTGVDEPVESCGESALGLSNSAQIGWQFHCLNLDAGSIVLATESYSRYTLLFSFAEAPSWAQVQRVFFNAYQDEVLKHFSHGGFMGWHQRGIVLRNFNKLQTPVLVDAVDVGFNQYLLNKHQCLQEALDLQAVNADPADKLKLVADYLNQQKQRLKVQDQDLQFFPLERFLADCLFRFGGGLCDVDIPGCKCGEFPNPHRANPFLSVVRR